MVEKKRAIEILEELRSRIPTLKENPKTGTGAFLKWHRDAGVAIEKLFPDQPTYKAHFNGIAFHTTTYRGATVKGAHERVFHSGMEKADALLHSMIEEVENFWSGDQTAKAPKAARAPAKRKSQGIEPTGDPRNVFVVHGRNGAARHAMFEFLRSIGLKPLEWSKIVAATGKPAPYIGEVLETGFSMARAVIVLFTPDDEAKLKKEFQKPDDPEYESKVTGQARPNVLFEAGMAMGLYPNRTVIIEIGNLRPFTDIGGRHLVRLNNSPQSRKDLATRLKSAGCNVDLGGDDWMTAGSFKLHEVPTAKPLKTTSIVANSTEASSTNNASLVQSLSPKELEIIATSKDGAIHLGFLQDASYRDAINLLLAKSLMHEESIGHYRLSRHGSAIRQSLKSRPTDIE